MKYSNKKKNFLSVNLLSIVALFLLILAGGIVRSAGSGMGCPDWPKCFGQYIPPTKKEQLPSDYKTKFIENQLKKNLKFAKMLNALGYNSLASKVRSNTQLTTQQEEFNAAKTWTEYINRLIGAITGILLLLTALYSFYYLKISKVIFALSLLNLILVAFQAWLGSIVVSTNLVPWIVTAHMLIALAILGISIYTYHKAQLLQMGKKIKAKSIVVIITCLALVLDVIQIIVGTEVREKIDEYASKLNDDYRQDWVNRASKVLNNHKETALLVVMINLFLFLIIRRNFSKHSIQQQLMNISLIIIMLQAFAGAVLSYWSLPPIAQVAHIILASLLFGAQFYLLLNLFRSAETLGTAYVVE